MTQFITLLLLFLLLPLAVSLGSDQPNIILILGEGSGWSSSSVQMDDRNPASKGTDVYTPSLERLAAAGMRFSDGYAASPRCTPSRAAVFTGISPAALHMTFVGDRRALGENIKTRVIPADATDELPLEVTTTAELLKQAGYATAHFGKWHVGRRNPSEHGFEDNDGANSNGGPENVTSPNPKQALAMTAQGIDFMERQVKQGKPFFLQMSHYPNQEEKEGGRNRQDNGEPPTVGITDKTMGDVLDAVERLGIRDNTYFIYTTDHGTPGRNPPLNGGKGTVWEGGLRVPFIIAGPGIEAGVCSHVRVTAMDLFPTFAEWAGIKKELPENLEGGSLVPVLMNKGLGTVQRAREEFVSHFPHYDKDPQGPASAIILGDYKLIRVFETDERKLFDLAKDLGEENNLAASRPDKVEELDQRLSDYLRKVNANMPTLNPNYDPSVTASSLPGETRRGGNRENRGNRVDRQNRQDRDRPNRN
ncbi:MAG: sulfatase [Verrucomicrobiae bacterium]|nr:sulfatase [Verrucomicrobiae bacterium]